MSGIVDTIKQIVSANDEVALKVLLDTTDSKTFEMLPNESPISTFLVTKTISNNRFNLLDIFLEQYPNYAGYCIKQYAEDGNIEVLNHLFDHHASKMDDLSKQIATGWALSSYFDEHEQQPNSELFQSIKVLLSHLDFKEKSPKYLADAYCRGYTKLIELLYPKSDIKGTLVHLQQCAPNHTDAYNTLYNRYQSDIQQKKLTAALRSEMRNKSDNAIKKRKI